VIVAHFYDIESGRKDLDQRGHGKAHEQFDIPIARDGGIQDLLTEAESPTRRFDGVICESIDRIARRTYYGTKIEHDLERAGVLLVAADEPMQSGRKRATAILTRRVKQGVAEWYVLETLEKSWDGFVGHAHQGYNVGRPPYGYVADKIPHPVPARREQGKVKSRLVPDPVRGSVVKLIYELYLNSGMGLLLIRDHLNADPASYPPPVPPDPSRALGSWSTSSIWEILRNPKYTGFMVWNRRARKGGNNRINPISEWVWSPVPMHEPLISMEDYHAVHAKATANERSRRRGGDGGGDTKEPRPRTVYLYRGLVRCGLCGQRLNGNKHRSGRRYYVCYPRKGRSMFGTEGHPKSLYLAEPVLHATVIDYLATAIFGPDRAAYWHDALAADADAADGAKTDRQTCAARLAELEATTADLTRRLQRQIINLEDDQLPAVARKQIAARIGQLEADITTHRDIADQLRDPGGDDTAHQDPDEIAAALARLPELARDLKDMPEPELRALFESLGLTITYRPGERVLDIQITLTDEASGGAGSGTNGTTPPDGPAGPTKTCSVPPARHQVHGHAGARSGWPRSSRWSRGRVGCPYGRRRPRRCRCRRSEPRRRRR
jgi:DNA invertase Pin-like site-specific DNA recombinase